MALTTWVLLWVISSGGTATSGSEYFQTEEACRKGEAFIETMNGFTRQAIATCIRDEEIFE